MLFALQKVEMLDEENFSLKDKEWRRHKRIHRLDRLGEPTAEGVANQQAPRCES